MDRRLKIHVKEESRVNGMLERTIEPANLMARIARRLQGTVKARQTGPRGKSKHSECTGTCT